jgi:hypothetical protein
MPVVRFTRHLVRYFPDLREVEVAGDTVRDVVRALDARWPGLAAYLVDDRGALRKHVNIFVRGEMVADRATLGDAVGPRDDIHVIQALSGG